ncbi:MAG: ParB/RepB/Spo0J family partition protein [Clostridiales bacterium]|nr:ParB/RepB/Spo0J family partition protein [Clostridiales bacterium]
MENKKPPRGLGRGLAALLPDTPVFLHEDSSGREHVLQISVSQIQANPHQPRRHFDEDKLQELAVSIREHGLLQPIIVMLAKQGYTIIAGERRWRAAQIAGLQDMPCIVRSLQQQQARELSLIENVQRENLQPLEEALAYHSLLEQYNYTQEDLAARLGKSRPYIANTLRLLNLAPQYQQLLREGSISAGHARAILSLTDARQQAVLAQRIVKDALSVRQAEQLAQALKSGRSAKETMAKSAPPQREQHPLYADIANRLKDKWGVKVAVHDKKGRGQIVIDYYSEDDLQRILDSLLEEDL